MKVLNTNLLVSLAMLSLMTTTLPAFANRGGKKPGAGKSQAELNKSIEKSKGRGVGKNSQSIRQKTSVPAVKTVVTFAIAEGLISPSRGAKVEKDIQSIKNAELQKEIAKAAKELSSQLKSKNLSAEAKNIVKNGLKFIASFKEIDKDFGVVSPQTVKDRDALKVLLSTIPRTMTWTASRQKNFGSVLRDLVESKGLLEERLHVALKKAKISREDLLKMCKR